MVSGARAAWLITVFSVLITARGVPVGTANAVNATDSNPGTPDSAIVGISASAALRFKLLMPSARMRPDLTCGVSAGAEPLYVPALKENGFLPDFAGLPEATLARLSAVYICSPSNPEGAVADQRYWQSLFALADAHDFIVLADECYADIWFDNPPPCALPIRLAQSGGFRRLLTFHSLSKRSGLPGLRSGMVAGDEKLIEALAKLHEQHNLTGKKDYLGVRKVYADFIEKQNELLLTRLGEGDGAEFKKWFDEHPDFKEEFLIAVAPEDDMAAAWKILQKLHERFPTKLNDYNQLAIALALLAWLHPLHDGSALGLPGRLLVCAAGLCPLGLCLTGVWRWTDRRRALRRPRAGVDTPAARGRAGAGRRCSRC